MNVLSKGVGFLTLLIIASTAAPQVWAQSASGSMEIEKPKIDMMMPSGAPTIPPVMGFSKGQKILFIHTETSDPKIAKILMDMMGGSPVLVVPSLAQAPEAMLAPVYVFTNGYGGSGPMGPLGGQPDIFDNAPGDPKYSPLRSVILVTWAEEKSARTLKSVADLQGAIDSGAVSTKKAGVVVNMPFLKWPGGKR